MRNPKFWDECVNGSIRKAVAEFIDKSPLLTHFKKEKYFNLEDDLVEFIEQQKETISQEVDREYQRDDVVDHVVEVFGEPARKVVESLPVDAIDNIVTDWQSSLDDDEIYWERVWDNLSDVLADRPIFDYLHDYSDEEQDVYCAYVKDWYASRVADIGVDYRCECPVCIDEFYNNEMLDEELAAYYTELAKSGGDNETDERQ